MSASDGRVIGQAKIADHGPASDLLNIVLVAEGYQESELGAFAAHAQAFVTKLFSTPPLDAYRCAFNVYRIDVASTESGADDPAQCADKSPGSGAKRKTYFDASFCGSGVRRGITVDEGLVLSVVDQRVPQKHLVIVLVNSKTSAGMGGSIAKTAVPAGWEDIAIHEMGHTLFGLADEYEYYADYVGCDEPDREHWPSAFGIRFEPGEANITIDGTRSNKWASLVHPSTPMPTTRNADCKNCDPQPNPVPPRTVGAFEGGGSYHCDIFRAEYTCKMRNASNTFFCAACEQRIRERLTPFQAKAVALAEPLPARFRQVHDYARANGFRGGFPTFLQDDPGVQYGCILIKKGFADFEEVSVAVLGNPTTRDERMRAVNDYAVSRGYVGGFPTFDEADHGAGTVYGCVLLKPTVGVWRDLRIAELSNPVGFEGRFQAVNDWAFANKFRSGIPNFHEADQGTLYECLFVKPGFADWEDVAASDLGDPQTPEARFRAVNDYATARGYVGGFPNFHQADYGAGTVYGCILVKTSAASWRDLLRSKLPGVDGFPDRIRAVHRWAVSNGFGGGLPNFHEAETGVVYGTILLKPGMTDWEDVPAVTLGHPASAEARMRAVYDYAISKGYVGGFPNFHEADYGAGVVYGCHLLKPSTAEWRDVRAADLGNPVGFEARFRAANDLAGKLGFFSGLPNFHEADPGPVYGTLLIKHGAADWQDVPRAELGNPSTPEQRFRATNDYATTHGYFGGFPNFHEAFVGVVYGGIYFRSGSVDWQDVPASTLGNPSTPEARMRAVNDYASSKGYPGGFPNFHEADYGAGVVYGCFLIKPGFADWADVPAATLGDPATAADRMRAVNDYAVARGYVGGFPNFHEADYGEGTVYGCILVKPSAADWRDARVADLSSEAGGFEGRFRAFNDYSGTIGYAAGLPNFHEADKGVVHGTILIKAGYADWQDVLASSLGNPTTAAARMQAVNDYAVSKGYVGGFPTFHEADYGAGVVYGCYLLKRSAAEWRDVLAADLGNPVGFEARFRAANDYASSHGFFSGFPNFHEASYGPYYGTVFLKAGAGDFQDVPASMLGNPGGVEARFRAVNDYGVANGYQAGFPNFHEADYGPVYGSMVFSKVAVSVTNISASALGDPSGPEARVRAVNDHAASLGFFAGYPTFRDRHIGVVYGGVLLFLSTADWRDVRASELNNPQTAEDRMREVHAYAVAQGYAGGFPNFHEADYGRVYGTIVLSLAAADWEDVPSATLGDPATPEARMRSVHDYAVGKGYIGGFPNFHQADPGGGMVYGCILLKSGYAEWTDVPAADLGNPASTESRFRAVHEWATSRGYLSGFPNFQEADYGAGTVYGCILVKTSAGEGRLVPVRRLCA